MSDEVAAVRAETEGRLKRHAKALEEGDVRTCLDLYTEDAEVRPANVAPVRGKVELENFFRRWFAAMRVRDGRYAIQELDVYQDLAYSLGAYHGAYQPHGKEAVPHQGSFMIVRKRSADGSWRYHRGIFNSSLPAEQTITSKGQ